MNLTTISSLNPRRTEENKRISLKLLVLDPFQFAHNLPLARILLHVKRAEALQAEREAVIGIGNPS